MPDAQIGHSQVEKPVFLLDCDNTLIDNDALKADMDAQLRRILGETLTRRFWQVYEDVRVETQTVNLPLTFERFRAECPDATTWEQAQSAVMDYPFATRLYPATLQTLTHLRTLGTPVILSDGDSVYQPRKIENSGLAAAVQGHVAIYIHKEDHLDEVMARWPAPYYVLVDDKPRILVAVKRQLPDRFVTVWIRQGHYALGPLPDNHAPDITLEQLDELRALTLADFRSHLGQSQPTGA